MSGKKQIVLALAGTLLVVTVLRAVESRAPGLGSVGVSLISNKMNRLPGLGDAPQQPLMFYRAPRDVPPVIHASFLLFDFKQNLRRWPVLAGDISRSPPTFLSL